MEKKDNIGNLLGSNGAEKEATSKDVCEGDHDVHMRPLVFGYGSPKLSRSGLVPTLHLLWIRDSDLSKHFRDFEDAVPVIFYYITAGIITFEKAWMREPSG